MVRILKESVNSDTIKFAVFADFAMEEPYSEDSKVNYDINQSTRWVADTNEMTEWFKGVGTQLAEPTDLSVNSAYLDYAEFDNTTDPYSGKLSVIAEIASDKPIREEDYSYIAEAIIEYAEYDLDKAVKIDVFGEAYHEDPGYPPSHIEPTYSYSEVDETETGISIDMNSITYKTAQG